MVPFNSKNFGPFPITSCSCKKRKKKIPRPSIFTHYESPGVLWPWPHSQVLWPWRPSSLVPGTCAGDEARRPSHCQVFSFLFFYILQAFKWWESLGYCGDSLLNVWRSKLFACKERASKPKKFQVLKINFSWCSTCPPGIPPTSWVTDSFSWDLSAWTGGMYSHIPRPP